MWLALAVGLCLSVLAAGAWHSQVQTQASRSFDAEAASVGASVTTGLRRMDDVTVAARTLIGTNPGLTNGELATWYRSIGAGSRYPGTLGFGFLSYVRAAQLPAYEAQVRADPIPGVTPLGKTLHIVPAGPRPSYCLIRLGVAGVVNRLIPGGYGLDVCAFTGARAMDESRDSGSFRTLSLAVNAHQRLLLVAAPVYRGGVLPATVAERRALMRGWVMGVFDLDTVLAAAVSGESGVAVTVARRDATAAPAGGASAPLSTVATVGTVSGGAFRQRFALDADGRWIVTVAKVPSWTPASPTVQALVVLVLGVLVSTLLFFLLRLLVQGRARALRMVAEKTDELRHQALHDALTGLPNRGLILDRAQQMLARGRRRDLAIGAMFVDLDGFKSVNDSFGHRAGDLLLCAVGERIAQALRETDSVGRLGGDEFVVLVEGEDDAGLLLVAERLLELLRRPFELPASEPPELSVTASIGVALGDRPDAEELLRDADIAMYEAKAAGKNRCVLFQSEMHSTLRDRVALDLDLRGAAEASQLRLLYQPTFDLTHDALIGVEALLRWEHPTRGTIEPAAFIPIAEENGQIIPIGRWVLHEACRQAADWRRRGQALDLSVNVSGRQLDDPELPAAVVAALSESGLEPSALVLEITESTLMRDPRAIAPRLETLKRLGVRIAIDDFGTGYSSLAYLQRFPVDAIKIDRTFISGIGRSPASTTIIRTLVQLARALELTTIAEGIEDQRQLKHLRGEACDAGQGFLLARPLEVAALEEILFGKATKPTPRLGRFRPSPSTG